MDRRTVYLNEIPYDTDFLEAQRFAYQGVGLLMLDLFGTATQFGGFAATPTTPASMSVRVGPGRIYKSEPLEATDWGGIDGAGGLEAVTAADSYIIKQGIRTTETLFVLEAPATVGHSIKYLIEGEFAEIDDPETASQFYNSISPTVPIQHDVSKRRRNVATLYLKAGTSGVTPTVPATTAGRIPLWVVTVANGQTTITAPNIVAHDDAPLISVGGGGGGGGTGLQAWQVLNAAHTTANGERLILDASGGSFTVTLPATPAAGWEVWIKGDFATNNVTIARNGATIDHSATDLILDADNVSAHLVYDGATWRV